MNVTKKVLTPVYVQAFCDCGKELQVSATITQGAKTTHIYNCECGIKTESDKKYPTIEYVLPDQKKVDEGPVENVKKGPIANARSRKPVKKRR